MTGLEIVEDDLESLSGSIGDVAAVAGADPPTATARVPTAISGATGASPASSAITAPGTRRDSLQERCQWRARAPRWTCRRLRGGGTP